MSSIGKKLTPLFIFASLLALQPLALTQASPSGRDVLRMTIVADTDSNKALAWL